MFTYMYVVSTQLIIVNNSRVWPNNPLNKGLANILMTIIGCSIPPNRYTMYTPYYEAGVMQVHYLCYYN